MSVEPIRPEDLPRWVPGDVLLASDGLGWRDVTLRSYRYAPLDVEVPPLQDYMIVAYRQGPTAMDRRFAGRWSHEDLVPGDVSLLTRVSHSHWHWTAGIDVVHVYLSARLMQSVCSEVFGRDVADIHLLDVLRMRDPVMFGGALAIAGEVAAQGLGGALYVDAIARQMCIHALRNYSTVSFHERAAPRGLSAAQARRLEDYIEAHLDQALTLEDLARELRISTHHLLRQFKARYGCAPHAFVIARRLDRARRLLATGDRCLKAIASACGFADQAHMTRLFRRHLGTTPSAFRAGHGPLLGG